MTSGERVDEEKGKLTHRESRVKGGKDHWGTPAKRMKHSFHGTS